MLAIDENKAWKRPISIIFLWEIYQRASIFNSKVEIYDDTKNITEDKSDSTYDCGNLRNDH